MIIFFAQQHCSCIICKQNEFGVWEIFLPNNADGSPAIPHGSRVKVTFLVDDCLSTSTELWGFSIILILEGKANKKNFFFFFNKIKIPFFTKKN